MKNSQPIQSPYPGLRPYREDEKDNFYGRDKDSQILSDKLIANRLTLLFAASGVGKSSLLNAAVIPELKSPTGKNLPVIVHNDWVKAPLQSLSDSIRKSLQQTVQQDVKSSQTLAELIQFYTLFSRHPLILILDQFEEFFRYQRHSDGFQAFIKQLTEVILNTQLPVSICLSMREDFALELNAFKPELPKVLFKNYYRLEELSPASTQQAILQPLKKAGYNFEEGLLDELIQDLLDQKTDRNPKQLSQEEQQKSTAPPYLQIVCLQLWQRDKNDKDKLIRKATYYKAGRAEGLSKNYINSELANFSHAEKQLASRAFDHLISHCGTKMAYTVAVLADTLRCNKNELQKVLNKLEQQRILRSQKRDDETWYELYHDMFSQGLSEWNTHWKNKMRIQKTLIGVFSIAFMGISIFAGYDYYQNASSYHIRSKNTPDARLELWQGKYGSADWFHQQHFIKETRYQRKDIEPDKCVTACNIDNYKDLNNELISNLSLLKRIAAYAESGVFGEFNAKDEKYSKTAFGLTQKTFDNANKENSLIAVKTIVRLPVNKAWQRLVDKELFNKQRGEAFHKRILNNFPLIASKVVIQRQPEIKSDNAYMDEHFDWILNNQNLENSFHRYSTSYGDPRKSFISSFGMMTESLLIKALADENGVVRSSTARTLETIKSEQAVPPLIKALADEDRFVRSSASDALGAIKSEQAVLPLIKALSDEDKNIRSSAADTLGAMKSEQAVSPLIKALVDEDGDVRISAADALGMIKSEQAVQPLIKALSDTNKNVRRSAANALGAIKSEQTVLPLIKALVDEDGVVRISAADALGAINLKQAVQPLIKTLADEDYFVRISAVKALGAMKSEQAVQPLIKAFDDEEWDVRSSAADALVSMKSEQVVQSLIKALDDEDVYVRHLAADALGEINSKQAIQPLIKTLNDKEWSVRYPAADALGAMKSKQAVLPLIKTLDDENNYVRRSAAKALGEINSKQAIQPLIKALNDVEQNVRSSAADALGAMKSEQAIQSLIKALSANFRSSAADALGSIKSEQAVQLLVKVLDDEDVYVRRSAATALTAINSEQVIPPLIKALSDDNWDDRSLAANALGAVKSITAIEELMKNLFDKDISGKNRFSLSVFEAIAKKYQLQFIANWAEKVRPFVFDRDKNASSQSNNDDTKSLKDKTPQQLVEQINNPKTTPADRIDALDALMESDQPELAQPILLKWFNEPQKMQRYVNRIIQYLAELHAVEVLEPLQQRLVKLNQQWQDWRDKRDALSNTASDEEKAAVDAAKPTPIVTAYTYASAIAQLDPDAGIQLLQYERYEARRGAWQGLAKNADIALIKKLETLRKKAKDQPLYQFALYQAIDQGLTHINVSSSLKSSATHADNKTQQPATPPVVKAYQADCKALNTWLNSGELDKTAATYQRVEWTRDRINETLEMLVRVEWRMKHWFDKEFPDKPYQYTSCYK